MAGHVVRVMRGTAKPGKGTKFRDYLEEKVIPRCQAYPGVISVAIGAPRPDKPDEFTVITIWKNLAALTEFVGPDWQRVYRFPDDEEHLEMSTVEHYFARA